MSFDLWCAHRREKETKLNCVERANERDREQARYVRLIRLRLSFVRVLFVPPAHPACSTSSSSLHDRTEQEWYELVRMNEFYIMRDATDTSGSDSPLRSPP